MEKPRAAAVENWSSFATRLKEFSKEDKADIAFAYRLAKKLHHGQVRESGERYFEHPRATALILIDECGIRDPGMIVAALLHDVVEDSNVIAHTEGEPYTEWAFTAREYLTRLFGMTTAEMIVNLTKPKPDGIEITNKDEAGEIYHSKLYGATPETVLVKMADRLHNLRTQYHSSKDKQQRKIDETREFYFPIFETARKQFPIQTGYLLNEMNKAIGNLNLD